MTDRYDAVTTPTFVVDREKARRNIARVAAKARAAGALFRPHFKTHQSAAVAALFREAGVAAITVSSLSMARAFAEEGWNDITIAFPLNVRELPAIDALAARVRLGLLVDSVEAVERLAEGVRNDVQLWVKIDLGARRSGVAADDYKTVLDILELARAVPRIAIQGLLTHDARTYAVVGRDAVAGLYAEGIAALDGLRRRLGERGFPGLRLSYGDTPTASLVDDFSGVDELRPGNFVYYDLQQYAIGACSAGDIACAVACPVVGVHPKRGEAVVYGGAVHLSRQDQLLPGGKRSFGTVFAPPGGAGSAWGGFVPDAYVRSVSQEHGVVVLPPGELAKLKVGDLLFVCPVHSCLAQDLLRGSTMLV